MYLQILKRDLKKKRTMNVILLTFIILAATFVSSSANNMTAVLTALEHYFELAEVPDYWFVTAEKESMDKFKEFSKENKYDYQAEELLQIDSREVMIDGKEMDYDNTLCLASLRNATNIFTAEDQKLKTINPGELYITQNTFHSEDNHFKLGSKIKITVDGKTKEFLLKGTTKDAMYGSSMMGITRFLLNESDYDFFLTDDSSVMQSCYVYTDQKNYLEKFNALNLNLLFTTGQTGIKSTYIMDTVIAAVMLIVSICLILISMVLLRFTIQFTMSEEFREIGVMKAIGIETKKIRQLYIVKYFAISATGSLIGFFLSIPFSNLMLNQLSQNIIIAGNNGYLLNTICSLLVAALVVCFCYLCTRRIKKFSPIDAIRNGESGERYTKKGWIHLSRSKLATIPFMALNDILSGARRYLSMIIIFTLGILLVIIPINSINTLQSDNLITWFNMAECDHIVSSGSEIFNAENDNYTLVQNNLTSIKSKIAKEKIDAEVYQEIMFRMSIIHGKKSMSSLAFQGMGDVTTEEYDYLEGSAPKHNNEIAISHLVADTIDAVIGDTVTIKNGDDTREYLISAIYQTMNNMGEGIRFYQKEQLNYDYISGWFAIQIKYTDAPNTKELADRKEILAKLFPEATIYTAGEYISNMMGDITGQLKDVKQLILIIVLCINILMTVLMVKSFLTKEKGEIATLKAIGFRNTSLILWQSLRIGIILFLSIVIGVLISTPLSELSAGQVFKIMGAQSIEFEIVPIEVYVIYPAIVLFVTVGTSILAAMQIRKISAADAANAE